MKLKNVLLLLTFVFCSLNQSTAQKKILVAYFSHSGNTKAVAYSIAKKTDAEIFEIKTVKPYPEDYNTVVDIAKKELRSDFSPVLASNVKEIRQFDIIFIGYPNWWGTYPQAVKVFLKINNLAGKTIIPFCTHEGSELGESVADLKKLCSKSTILQGLAIQGKRAHNSDDRINDWLQKLKVTK